MPNKHYIKFTLEVVADEMDGTSEESALIIQEILDQAIGETIADFYILTVVDHGELEGRK